MSKYKATGGTLRKCKDCPALIKGKNKIRCGPCADVFRTTYQRRLQLRVKKDDGNKQRGFNTDPRKNV